MGARKSLFDEKKVIYKYINFDIWFILSKFWPLFDLLIFRLYYELINWQFAYLFCKSFGVSSN